MPGYANYDQTNYGNTYSTTYFYYDDSARFYYESYEQTSNGYNGIYAYDHQYEVQTNNFMNEYTVTDQYTPHNQVYLTDVAYSYFSGEVGTPYVRAYQTMYTGQYAVTETVYSNYNYGKYETFYGPNGFYSYASSYGGYSTFGYVGNYGYT